MIETVREYKYICEKEETVQNKIVILTTRNDENLETFLYETVSEYKKVLDKRKIPYYILFTENAYIVNKDDKITIYNVDDKKGYEISPTDTVILNRNVTSQSLGSLGIMSTFEKNNFVVVNTRECVEVCSDKYRTILRLEEHDIKVPKTFLIQDELTLERLLPEIEYPCVVKTLTGSEGVGVFISESKMNLISVLQTIWKINEYMEVIIQEFIETDGDYRAIFINGEYIASMKRLKIEDDFRSNFSLGGSTEKYKLTDDEIELCKRVVNVVKGKVIGVDFMKDADGEIYIIEANSSPGSTGITKTSGVNVAEKTIDYMSSISLDKNKMITEL